ncbi:MAG: DUF5004 domain-containing protein [Cytophagales bacterium]|nr:MAG: DUF5004 domain-containing protein [Cytophagales bacterium]
MIHTLIFSLLISINNPQLIEKELVGKWTIAKAIDNKTNTDITQKIDLRTIILSADNIYTITYKKQKTSTGIWKIQADELKLSATPSCHFTQISSQSIEATFIINETTTAKITLVKMKN